MKILFVQKEGGIFGAENYQLKVIPGLLAKGIEIVFLRLYTNYQGGKGGEFISRLNAMGVSTEEVNIGKYPSISVLRRIHRIVKGGSFDLVHTHLIHADFHLVLAKMFFNGKYTLVSTKHGYDNSFTSKFGFDASKQTKTPYFLISRWSEKRVKASYTISKGLLVFFKSTGLTTNDKMSLIPYGFDMPEHYLMKGNSDFRVASKQLIIAGRLVGFKGHRYLIESMAILVKKYNSNVKLLIAGTGGLEEELKAQVANLNLNDNIEFLGYSNDVGAFMANSDVVVIPSVSEGFGVVFLEAFAAKTPVVAWDVPAGNELITPGSTGYLVAPYDVKLLANQLMEILDKPEVQETITENAFANLVNYYQLERMIDQTMSFYNKVIAR